MDNKKYIDRLYNEWTQNSKIIIAVDFDDTISPWRWKSDEDISQFKDLIKLLNLCFETGAYIVIFTACNSDRHDEIRDYCKKMNLPISSININPIDLPYGKNGKIYANIFLDDRGGLNEAIHILTEAMYRVRADRAAVNDKAFLG